MDNKIELVNLFVRQRLARCLNELASLAVDSDKNSAHIRIKGGQIESFKLMIEMLLNLDKLTPEDFGKFYIEKD